MYAVLFNCTVAFLFAWILCAELGGPGGLTLGQVDGTDGASVIDESAKETILTFSAVGKISSLNFDNNTVADIASAQKVILSGDWSLNVNNGNLSFFEADFIAAPSDGSISHTHQIINLVPEDGIPIQITSNGNASISGNADVKIEGLDAWGEVNATIIVSQGSTLTIILDDKGTEHHFMGQPIYGIVDRLMY